MINLNSSSNESVSNVATKIETDLKKEAKKLRIKDIIEKISKSNVQFKSPYNFLDYLEESGMLDSINSVLNIIGRYKDSEYESTIDELNKDLAILSSHLIYIGTKLGEVQGNVVRLENIKKLTRSKYIVEAIKTAEETYDKISYQEADSISRILSEDSYIELDMLGTVEKYLTNLMFNTRFFCQTLDNIAKRMIRDEHGTTKE